jgi:peptide/nickel transport system permease protein
MSPPRKENKRLDSGKLIHQSHGRMAFRYLMGNKAAKLGLVIVAVWTLVAVLAPLIAPLDPNSQNLYNRLQKPLGRAVKGNTDFIFLLGSDSLGRDLLSRLIYGARVSLFVGLASALGSLAIGCVIGALAGYIGGRTDECLMALCDLQMAFPAILMALAIMAVLGSGVVNLVIVFTVTGWVQYARTLRAEILHIKEQDFVKAARALGAYPVSIIVQHILPNAFSAILVLFSFQVAQMITMEAALSFLGVGIPPTIPSWGRILSDGREFIYSALWLSLLPGLCLMSLVAGIYFLGDALRDALDPMLVK